MSKPDHSHKQAWPPQLSKKTYLLLWVVYFILQITCAWLLFNPILDQGEKDWLRVLTAGPSMLATFFLAALQKKQFDRSSVISYSMAMLLMGWPLGLFVSALLSTPLPDVPGDALLVVFIPAMVLTIVCPIWLVSAQNKFVVCFCSGVVGFILPVLFASGMEGMSEMLREMGKL